MPDVVMYQGNRSPSVSDTIRVNGVAFDLSTATGVRFRMRARQSSTLVVDAVAVVVSAVAGTVRYDWAALDVANAGEFVGWWSVTLAGGNLQDTPEFAVHIEGHALVTTADLVSIADVRAGLEIQPTDHSRDPLIGQYISQASVIIGRYCWREFAPATASATRRFRVDTAQRRVDFGMYDLRSATTVVVNPEDAPGQTLVAESDYRLDPVTPYTTGTYKGLTLSMLTNYGYSSHWYRYGESLCDVTGAWGMLTVPLDVQRACIITVGAWIDRASEAYGASDLGNDDPRVVGADMESSYKLPPAACATLKPFRKLLVA